MIDKKIFVEFLFGLLKKPQFIIVYPAHPFQFQNSLATAINCLLSMRLCYIMPEAKLGLTIVPHPLIHPKNTCSTNYGCPKSRHCYLLPKLWVFFLKKINVYNRKFFSQQWQISGFHSHKKMSIAIEIGTYLVHISKVPSSNRQQHTTASKHSPFWPRGEEFMGNKYIVVKWLHNLFLE